MSVESQPPERTARSGLWFTRARITFRWVRITALAFTLFLVLLLLWCNYVGVPQPIANLVRAELLRKDFSVEFSGLKLQGFRHIVATDLRFASRGSNDLPSMEVSAAELIFDSDKLRSASFEISGMQIQGGRIFVPIHASNEPPRFLVISNVTSEVSLSRSYDSLRVTRLTGETLGAKAQANGMLRNISAGLRRSRPGQSSAQQWEFWKRQLREVVDIFAQLQFVTEPSISLRLTGDLSSPTNLFGALNISSGPAASPGVDSARWT